MGVLENASSPGFATNAGAHRVVEIVEFFEHASENLPHRLGESIGCLRTHFLRDLIEGADDHGLNVFDSLDEEWECFTIPKQRSPSGRLTQWFEDDLAGYLIRVPRVIRELLDLTDVVDY